MLELALSFLVFGLPALVMIFIKARVPFDLPEVESEIIAFSPSTAGSSGACS